MAPASQLFPVGATLEETLRAWAASDSSRSVIVGAVLALAHAGTTVSRLAARGPLAGELGADTGARNADGDSQKALDVAANTIVLDALKNTAVAYYASEEEDAILTLNAGGNLAIAVDPLDGSSNIDINAAIGTIFSILPVSAAGATASFLRPSSEQLAAGYFIYGAHTALMLTLGEGVDLYVLDPDTETFRLSKRGVRIDAAIREYAINASNNRHWSAQIRSFIEDCVAGDDGPRVKNFNMRWVACVIGEAHRILTRGGIYLYPADRRAGYENGRLRLLYEAAPLAMLVEQAGGAATDGIERILDKIPAELHQRTPLVFGSPPLVELVRQHHLDPSFAREVAPLFQQRGLFSS
ncbi:MAG: class 1 fructose-bisphosphatase [Phycisphaerales bacterium]|nr:class 1 fructose-bisphosphatase [Hyphomonadaceae bacterium]